MQSLRYLNMILTVVAVVLTLNLWTSWTSSADPAHPSMFEAPAIAASRTAAPPNPAALRVETNKQLKALNTKVDTLVELFKTGKARVAVSDNTKRN